MWRRITLWLVLGTVLIAVLSTLGYSLGAWDRTNPQVAAALLTATGTSLAASVAVLVWEYKAHLDRETAAEAERRVRNERVRDTVLAIAADVKSDRELLQKAFSPDQIEAQLAAFDRNVALCDRHPLPRPVQSSKSLVLSAIERDITILPEELIGSVVTYYELDFDMGSLGSWFAEGKFDNLPPHRQREGMVQYLELARSTAAPAETLTVDIKRWLEANPSDGPNDRRKHVGHS